MALQFISLLPIGKKKVEGIYLKAIVYCLEYTDIIKKLTGV